LTTDQLEKVEKEVNSIVESEMIVNDRELEYEKASKITGLRTVPGEVYPDPVRLVVVGKTIDEILADPTNPQWANYSIEFCGGTHLRETKVISKFVLTHEEAVGKGVRRVVAVTGFPAQEAIQNSEAIQRKIASLEKVESVQDRKELVAQLLKEITEVSLPAAQANRFREQLGDWQGKIRKSEKDTTVTLQGASANFSQDASAKLLADPTNVPKSYAARFEDGANGVLLTETIKKIQSSHESLANLSVLLISADPAGKKALAVASVPKAFHSSLTANVWANETAKILGGKGGGKPETAQGSGPKLDQVDAAVTFASSFASERLN
jgi:alanyl-tRNA synthetase